MTILLSNITTIVCFLFAYLSFTNGMKFVGSCFFLAGIMLAHVVRESKKQ